MKGLKALKQRPFEKHVTAAVCCENQNHLYCALRDYLAYTAEIATTVNGDVLVVCLYGISDNSKKRKLKMPIIERHFLSESGEIAAERFAKNFTANAGTFTITTSEIGGWGLSDAVYYLAHERYPEKYIPVENADEVILRFAKKYKLYNPIKQTFYTANGNHGGYTSGLCWLAAYQTKFKADKSDEAKARLEDRTKNRMSQIGEGEPIEFAEWICDEKFSPAAWFYKYKNRTAEGICGACEEKSVIPNVQNKKYGTCPICGRPIQYISIKNNDKVCRCLYNAVMIQRVSESEFVSRYFEIRKKYSSNDYTVESDFDIAETAREFWSVKNSEIVKTGVYKANYRWTGCVCELINWKRIPPRYSVSNPGRKFPGNILEITQTLSELLNMPILKNMDLRPLFENNEGSVPTAIFKQAIETPSIENMAKMGLTNLANGLIDYSSSDIVKPIKSSSPAKQLKIDRLTLRKFAEMNITLGQYNFWITGGFTPTDFDAFRTLAENYPGQFRTLSEIRGESRLIHFDTMARYLEKQRIKCGLSAADVVIYWRDYLQMTKTAGNDIDHNRNLVYPENLKTEHDRMMRMKELAKNARYEKKLCYRAEILDNLSFSNEEFLIEPLRTVQDFLNESSALNHCVKTYVEQCADGKTNIFGLRKIDEPDKPYFTVNIDNRGGLIQNRGKNNCDSPKEVKAFVAKWLKFVEKKLKTLSLEPSSGTENLIRIGA